MVNDEEVSDILILLHETNFQSSSYIIKYNYKYWSDNSMQIYERPLQSER
jgi:hypothetical protein